MNTKNPENKLSQSNAFPTLDESTIQHFSFDLTKKFPKASTPKYSRLRTRFKPDKDFSKLLLKNISKNKERLLEENTSLNLKISEISEENTQLKAKMTDLMSQQDEHPEKSIPKLKQEYRELQSLLAQKEEEIEKLEKNLKSTRINQLENEVSSYIKEAKCLSCLLERMHGKENSTELLDFQEKTRLMATNMQSLKKESAYLSQALNKSQIELEQLQAKLDKLENKKDQEILLKEIKGFSKTRDNEKKEFQNWYSEAEKKQKELTESVNFEKSLNEKIRKKLEKNEKIASEKNRIITSLKELIDKQKSIKETMPKLIASSSIRQQLEIKLLNPPRLLIKVNQILKKKKMLISVFLSLIDKHSNGFIHKSLFLAGIKKHGKKIKEKHVDEIMKHLGNNSNYIELNKLEQLFEKYQYKEYYKTSSEDESPAKKPQVLPITLQAVPKAEQGNEPKQNASLDPAKESEKIVELVSPGQVKEFLNEIREKMINEKLLKSKLPLFLFGNNFDPDSDLTSSEIEGLLTEKFKDFKSFHLLGDLSKFLTEPESGTYKESAYKKIKGSIRNGCRKIGKFLDDWEVFTDEEIENFERDFKTSFTMKFDEIIKAFRKTNSGSKTLKFSGFLELLRGLDVSFSDRMISWVVQSKGVNKKEDEINVEEFIKEFKGESHSEINPEKLENKHQSEGNDFSIEFFLKSLAGILSSDSSVLPLCFNSFTSDEFLDFIQNLGLKIKKEDLISNFSKTENDRTVFDPIKVLSMLGRYGFGLKENYDHEIQDLCIDESDVEINEKSGEIRELDREFKENEDIQEELVYEVDGLHNQDFEEDIKEAFAGQNSHETSLEFEQYGINLN